jgi:replicative DNA helicase
MSSTPKFRRENSVASDLRAPPHSIEAEQAVLGGLMLDRAAGTTSATSVRPTISSGPITRSFSRASRRWRRGAALRSGHGVRTPAAPRQAAGCGGLAYLGTLTRDTPGAANARAYARSSRSARCCGRS